jgi:hypothetical protein
LENLLFKYFIFLLASVQFLTGLTELIAPVMSYGFWKRWVRNRYFYIHGLFLIAAGFPLTIYKGYFSGILFVIGLIIVLTGPFILIYPEKIKEVFYEAERDMNPDSIKKLIYFDSAMRISFAVILYISFYRTFYIQ